MRRLTIYLIAVAALVGVLTTSSIAEATCDCCTWKTYLRGWSKDGRVIKLEHQSVECPEEGSTDLSGDTARSVNASKKSDANSSAGLLPVSAAWRTAFKKAFVAGGKCTGKQRKRGLRRRGERHPLVCYEQVHEPAWSNRFVGGYLHPNGRYVLLKFVRVDGLSSASEFTLIDLDERAVLYGSASDIEFAGRSQPAAR